MSSAAAGSVHITYKLDAAEINRQMASAEGPIIRDVLRRALRTETGAKRRCPANHGRLRGSITHRIVHRDVYGITVPVAEVGTDVDYALYVHNGTGIYGPHQTPIQPVTATVLHWVDAQGNHIFARSVRGQPPKPFLRDALHDAVT